MVVLDAESPDHVRGSSRRHPGAEIRSFDTPASESHIGVSENRDPNIVR